MTTCPHCSATLDLGDAPAAEQLGDARRLFVEAARCLLRAGVSAWAVRAAADGLVRTLELIERKPGLRERFVAGEEPEEWRR